MRELEFYFPKTKSKHMAMPTTGKKYPSKGGTVRFGVQASMNGSMSLPKYVKEEEFYDYGFGVDSVVRKYPQKFLDAFYDFDSNPTADTQDDETVAIAYQAWYQKQAENEVLNAEVSVGEKQIRSRKDYDIDNELSGFSNMEVGDIDLEDYEDEITEAVEDEVIEAIRESVDDNMPISDGLSVASNVNVDTELEITVPISGDIDYDWTANETYEEEVDDDEWNAETGLEAITEPEVFGGSNYAVKMIKNAQNHLKMVREAESFEAPYGGIGSLFGIGGDTEIGGFSTSELTGSSAIHGDFDSASLNYSGHQNLQVRADAKEAEAVIIHGKKKMHPSVKTPLRTVVAHKIGVEDKDGFIPTYIDAGDFKDGITLSEGLFENHAETVVGNPSPSSPLEEVPATVPSPAEPTNESFNAEMDELSEDTSIIRNRVGDMVGMVELDENDEDIEKVDVDIKDEDGEMAYEGTLGAESKQKEAHIVSLEMWEDVLKDNPNDEEAKEQYDYWYEVVHGGRETPFNPDYEAETFESQGTNTKMILGITALAVGLGLWKGKEIMSISEKIGESIKNMKK
tara:strand:- start:1046 stop:2752 length:1707 start_codon:yes stop_codon:yes gene_type:complete